MADTQQDLKSLVADARLMANYAVRVGRLQNPELLDAIRALEASKNTGPAVREHMIDLLRAMNGAAQAIAPITLVDLGSKWRPFPEYKFDFFRRIFFACLAGVTIILLCNLTFNYTRATSIAHALSEVRSENFRDKSEHLYKRATQLGLVEPRRLLRGDPEYYDYLRDYNEVLSTQKRLNKYISDANELYRKCHLPEFYFAVGLLPSAPQGEREESNSDDRHQGLINPDALSRQQGYNRVEFTSKNNTESSNFKIANINAAKSNANSTAIYYADMTLFLYQIGITLAPPNDYFDTDIQISRSLDLCDRIISIYGGWLLPAIYGLLGALVFQLRSIMNPLVPPPNFGAVIVRAALAMMAGVSISWFEGSFSAAALDGHQRGLTVFGLAFVFGFSIDIFFAILDRIVVSTSKTILGKT